MSRLRIDTQNTAEKTVEELYKDLKCRSQASQPGLCPVDLTASFLKTCYAQSCGKCVPCRVGHGQLEKMLDQVLDSPANPDLLDLIERTAESIYFSSDCTIGSEAARMILKGVRGFREDYIDHIKHGMCCTGRILRLSSASVTRTCPSKPYMRISWKRLSPKRQSTCCTRTPTTGPCPERNETGIKMDAGRDYL